MVRLGIGTWHQHRAWDGHKYVCEDDFLEENECLVYTFGVSTDASFEEAMASKGAKYKNSPKLKYHNKFMNYVLQDARCMHMTTLYRGFQTRSTKMSTFSN